MLKKLDAQEYVNALMEAIRPPIKVQAFYEHRVGAVCTDPKAMFMLWDDHLVHRGDGIFEGLKFVDRKLYQLDEHLERMQRSCKAIHMKPPCSWEEMRRLVIEVCQAGGQDSGIVKIMLGRGPGSFGVSPDDCPFSSLYIVVSDLHVRPESDYEKGMTAFRTTVPAKQPYLATIKSIDYLPNVLMKREAVEKGYDYPFCFNEHDFLAEGATENVCIVDQNDKLVIPEFTNALAGTTLMRAVDLLKHDTSILFRGISEDEILEAKEVIICGTSLDAISVVRYNDKPIHAVRPGPVSIRMRELLRKDIAENGLAI